MQIMTQFPPFPPLNTLPSFHISFVQFNIFLLSYSPLLKHTHYLKYILWNKFKKKMEPNLSIAAKKMWSLVRVLYFMVRKGIAKRKLMVDLNMMMKRGKIAGKALHNLMFHHHQNWAAAASTPRSFSAPRPGDYEFSCSNSPAYPISLFLNKHRKNHTIDYSHFYSCNQSPATAMDDDVAAVVKALEMLQHSEAASPALPGFGRSPLVRQLRITDSPFPLSNDVGEDSSHVDEAAEEFIIKFYKDLKNQNLMSSFG